MSTESEVTLPVILHKYKRVGTALYTEMCTIYENKVMFKGSCCHVGELPVNHLVWEMYVFKKMLFTCCLMSAHSFLIRLRFFFSPSSGLRADILSDNTADWICHQNNVLFWNTTGFMTSNFTSRVRLWNKISNNALFTSKRKQINSEIQDAAFWNLWSVYQFKFYFSVEFSTENVKKTSVISKEFKLKCNIYDKNLVFDQCLIADVMIFLKHFLSLSEKVSNFALCYTIWPEVSLKTCRALDRSRSRETWFCRPEIWGKQTNRMHRNQMENSIFFNFFSQPIAKLVIFF